MKKLISTTVFLFITSQANAAIYGITYTFERDAPLPPTIAPDKYYLYSKPLTTATPDPLHLLNSSFMPFYHPGGAESVYGTGTIDTVSGDIVLNGIDIELAIPTGSIGFFGYTQTLHGFFMGTTYANASTETNWDAFVCEQGFESSNPCLTGEAFMGTGRVDPDGIIFDYLGVGGKGSFFFKEDIVPSLFYSLETRMNFEIVTPIPAAAWLFGSALLGLAGIGRQRR